MSLISTQELIKNIKFTSTNFLCNVRCTPCQLQLIQLVTCACSKDVTSYKYFITKCIIRIMTIETIQLRGGSELSFFKWNGHKMLGAALFFFIFFYKESKLNGVCYTKGYSHKICTLTLNVPWKVAIWKSSYQ